MSDRGHPRASSWSQLAARILALARVGAARAVAVTACPASGKTTLAAEVAAVVDGAGRPVVRGGLRRLPPAARQRAATGGTGPRPRATWTTRYDPDGAAPAGARPGGRRRAVRRARVATTSPVTSRCDRGAGAVAAGSVVLVEGSFLLVAGPRPAGGTSAVLRRRRRRAGARRGRWPRDARPRDAGRRCASCTCGATWRPESMHAGARRPVVARRRGGRPHRPGRAPAARADWLDPVAPTRRTAHTRDTWATSTSTASATTSPTGGACCATSRSGSARAPRSRWSGQRRRQDHAAAHRRRRHRPARGRDRPVRRARRDAPVRRVGARRLDGARPAACRSRRPPSARPPRRWSRPSC